MFQVSLYLYYYYWHFGLAPKNKHAYEFLMFVSAIVLRICNRYFMFYYIYKIQSVNARRNMWKFDVFKVCHLSCSACISFNTFSFHKLKVGFSIYCHCVIISINLIFIYENKSAFFSILVDMNYPFTKYSYIYNS